MTIQKTFTRKTIDDQHNFKMAFRAGWDIVTTAFIHYFEEYGLERRP
mgnify:CR=1 FL=1